MGVGACVGVSVSVTLCVCDGCGWVWVFCALTCLRVCALDCGGVTFVLS